MIHLACPHCDAANRLPPDKPAEAAKCGRCHQPLFTGAPVALDGPRLQLHLSRTDLPVIVDFWAAWCGPCRSMAPIFDAAARELEPRARFAKVDVDASQDAAARYGVQSIPALFAFQGGRVVERHAGLVDGAFLRSWVARLAKPAPGA